jgi:hypothetical protein
MNIFVLHRDPQICAQAHSDKHVVKMILESTQLLFNAYTVTMGWGQDKFPFPAYKPAHVNHPCAIWTRKNIANFRWLLYLAYYLCAEYYKRYGKEHKCFEIILWMMSTLPKLPYRSRPSRRPQAMPDFCKFPGKPVCAYRFYYIYGKRHINTWARGVNPPNWY